MWLLTLRLPMGASHIDATDDGFTEAERNPVDDRWIY